MSKSFSRLLVRLENWKMACKVDKCSTMVISVIAGAADQCAQDYDAVILPQKQQQGLSILLPTSLQEHDTEHCNSCSSTAQLDRHCRSGRPMPAAVLTHTLTQTHLRFV
jgi:hypothetical protein